MGPFSDGSIDAKKSTFRDSETPRRSEASVRESIATFRGKILSEAYTLECKLSSLVVWHLFRDRQDGMAAFFEDNILMENSFGLDRKVRLAVKVGSHWLDTDQEIQEFRDTLHRAKEIRNRIAHWPTILMLVVWVSTGEVVDYTVEIVKGDHSFHLCSKFQLEWLSVLTNACEKTDAITNDLIEMTRSGDHDD